MVQIDPALPPLPLKARAWQWLQWYGVRVEVKDPHSTRGGGLWWPDKKLVELETAQEEAAIHELAHAWWEEQRKNISVRTTFSARWSGGFPRKPTLATAGPPNWPMSTNMATRIPALRACSRRTALS